jgi:hypothetical protein
MPWLMQVSSAPAPALAAAASPDSAASAAAAGPKHNRSQPCQSLMWSVTSAASSVCSRGQPQQDHEKAEDLIESKLHMHVQHQTAGYTWCAMSVPLTTKRLREGSMTVVHTCLHACWLQTNAVCTVPTMPCTDRHTRSTGQGPS